MRGERKGAGDYGWKHRRLRAAVAREVAAGRATCSRCHRAIAPGDAFHLDHDDADRRRYIGPSHEVCNTSAGGRKGAQVTAARRRARKQGVTKLRW